MTTHIARTWNALPDDTARWKFLLTIQNHGLIVWLDNDMTGVRFKDILDEYPGSLNLFVESIGDSPGIPALLEAIGIEGECV